MVEVEHLRQQTNVDPRRNHSREGSHENAEDRHVRRGSVPAAELRRSSRNGRDCQQLASGRHRPKFAHAKELNDEKAFDDEETQDDVRAAIGAETSSGRRAPRAHNPVEDGRCAGMGRHLGQFSAIDRP